MPKYRVSVTGTYHQLGEVWADSPDDAIELVIYDTDSIELMAQGDPEVQLLEDDPPQEPEDTNWVGGLSGYEERYAVLCLGYRAAYPEAPHIEVLEESKRELLRQLAAERRAGHA